MSPRRTTYRQRQASRRNLRKARAAKARRRRSDSGVLITLGLVVLVGAIIIGLIQATHGLILLLLVAAVAGWVWLRVRRRRAWEAEAERLQQERMERARHLDALLAVSPTEFEQTIAVLLSASGCVDVTRAGGPGDLTADITCRDANGRYLIVQCKQYSPNQKVGSVAMQQFIGMGHVHHGAERMVYVTTADFTKPARDLAAQHHIELVDGSVLVEWAKRSAGWTSVASLAPKTQTERIDLPHRDNL